MSSLITAPEGYDPVRAQEHTGRALRYLLTTWPNRIISTAEVVDVLGYRVTAQAVSNAAARLRRGHFGMHIRSRGGNGGGYMLLVPVPATNGRRCECCTSRSLIGTCRLLRGRPVDDGEWCGGFS